jgi:uncharacterized protein (TIGR02466 family)
MKKLDLIKRFPTPIWTTRLKNIVKLNKEMLTFIYGMREKDPTGVQKSNMLGWHSRDFDFPKSPPIIKFFKKITPLIKQVTKDLNWDNKNYRVRLSASWAIINPKYACNQDHIHPNNFISAAYYVNFPKTMPKNSGRIVFKDPRPSHLFFQATVNKLSPLNENEVTVQPATGVLAMFPSYLYHWVEPNLSDEDRVIISFNLRQEQIRQPLYKKRDYSRSFLKKSKSEKIKKKKI